MTKLLRGLAPDLPDLRFKTQQTEGAIRPDMWGFANSEPRVFVENKFWAGLTDNQPVSYLRQLAKYSQPSILLIVAPASREQTLWRELTRRLVDAGISASDRAAAAGVFASVTTQLGPNLALTSWTNVLSILEHEVTDAPVARADLVQLRALCDAADSDAFSPVSKEELSNQRTPAFMLQLSSIVQDVVDRAVTKGVLDLGKLKPQANAERIGRYTGFRQIDKSGTQAPGAWLGINFRLWKKHGTTPLWIVFHDSEWGQARAAETLLEPWVSREGILAFNDDDGSYVVALDLPAHEENTGVVEAIVTRLEQMSRCLNARSASESGGQSNG